MADLLRSPSSSDTVAVIARFLRVLHGGGVFEVRAPKCLDRPGSTFASTTSGYFQAEHIEDAAAQIAELDASGRAPNIYVTLNPVRPDLLARSANRLKSKAAETTADADIVARRWMLVDCDAVRPSGVSATDAELALAEAKADEVLAFLTERGWPEPVRVMSGNGHHLLYRVDLPADDGGLIKAVLGTIAATFDGGGVTIDRSVHNAARITKVAGTMARKGDHLVGVAGVEDRPHRRSVLLSAPENAVVVPKETLEALVNALATPTTVPVAKPEMGVPRTAGHTQRPRRDTLVCTPDGVRAYLEQHGVEVKGESRNGTKTILKLACCPVTPSCVSTGDSDIAVLVNDDGSIGYKNQHNRGEGITWHDVRATIDPDYAAYSRPRMPSSPVALYGVAPSVGSVSSVPGVSPENWPDPSPLPSGMPPVEPFDLSLLPNAYRPWIEDVAERIQCPPDFPAVAAMVVTASVVGRRVGIRPKQHDDWLVVPNLWGAVIGRPGVMKTPAIQEAIKALNRLEIAAKEEFETRSHEAAADRLVAEVRKKGADKLIKNNLGNPDEAKRIAMEALAGSGEDVVRRRYIVNDPTVEKLGEVLNENPTGVLLFRDELTGFLRGLDKEGNEPSRAFFLEAWNGNGRYTFDRIGRGTVDIEAATVSIMGGIQPGPLMQYLSAAARQGAGDDGLLQRFQLLVWPDIGASWINIDRPVNKAARDRAYGIIDRLANLEPCSIRANVDSNACDIPYLRFDAKAQTLFDTWRAELERTVRDGGLVPALESHLAKYRSLIPSLALLIHLVDGGTGPVTATAVTKAIRWGSYLESHARRLYGQMLNPDLAAARVLADRLIAGDLQDGFRLRDVYRRGWTGLGTKPEAQAAVDYLIDLDWLRSVERQTPGRSATEHLINPKITAVRRGKKRESATQGTDRTDRRPNIAPSVGSVTTSLAFPQNSLTPDESPANENGFIYEERLAVAETLDMPIEPGSEAEAIARTEAGQSTASQHNAEEGGQG